MSACKKCQILSESLDDGQRWTMAIETQRCIWDSPEAMPEVDTSYADGIAAYCCEDHALKGIDEYLLQVGAKTQWSDVRPIENCACCGQDFDTTVFHKVLVLSDEVVHGNSIDQNDVRYAARFCTECVP